MTSKIKLAIFGFLAISLSATAYMLREEIKDSARLALGIERLESQLNHQQDVIGNLLSQQEFISNQNVQLREDMKAIKDESEKTNQFLIQLGEEDEEYNDWRGGSLPESIIDRLLQQREDRDEDWIYLSSPRVGGRV